MRIPSHIALSTLAISILSILMASVTCAEDVVTGVNTGTAASDQFVVKGSKVVDGTAIDGLMGSKDNQGLNTSSAYDTKTTYSLAQTLGLATDATVVLQFRATGKDANGQPVYSTSSISTYASRLGTPNYTDSLTFQKSGDFTNLEFSNIEEVRLADGVSVKIAGEALDTAISSLDLGLVNPGLHFYGTPGGRPEVLTVVANAPESLLDGTSYYQADIQLDDASTGNLVHDGLQIYFDFRHTFDEFKNIPAVKSGKNSMYARMDGSNNDDHVIGSAGIDNITVRLGNDVVDAGEGNDYIVGGPGADQLKGGNGDDLFVLSGFTGLRGNGEGKSSDGSKHWVKGDLIDGGAGIDTLRISAGATDIADGVIRLTDANFKQMESVEIGSSAARLTSESGDAQVIYGHKYLNTATTEKTGTGVAVGESYDNVSVDASGVKLKGLLFTGNGNANRFVGTASIDTFVSNGGHDQLTGGKGKNTYQYGFIYQSTANNTTNVYEKKATPLTSADSDTISDFHTGTDKIRLEKSFFTGFSATGVLPVDALAVGEGGGTVTEATRLIFDTSSYQLSYDADGAGSVAPIAIATLSGVKKLGARDFVIF